ncbi:hypothetical protein BC940DRAFT_321397 [Gongronella butleri]|nr:hypothetical protein BC940DRAFT_321397 [Gongronella butleri]
MAQSIDFDAPRAAWLFKLSHGFGGKPKWNPRFFILLDNELRCYRDEHAESPSQILHLSDIGQVIPLLDRANTFRLEPSYRSFTLPGGGSGSSAMMMTRSSSTRGLGAGGFSKPWTIECSSQQEMAIWYECLRHRLERTPVFAPPPPPPVAPLPPSAPQMAITRSTTSSHFFAIGRRTLKTSFSTPIIKRARAVSCTSMNSTITKDAASIGRRRGAIVQVNAHVHAENTENTSHHQIHPMSSPPLHPLDLPPVHECAPMPYYTTNTATEPMSPTLTCTSCSSSSVV